MDFTTLSPAHFLWLPPAALAFDLLLTDPRTLPHPVQGIGWLADALEGPARRLPSPILAGALALAAILAVTGGCVALLLSLPSLFGFAAALYAGWSVLALGGLLREGEFALQAIEQSPEAGQAAVGMLVSRDTSGLGREDLRRTLAETLSENFNDAFVAPFFWLLCTGPVGVWIYKAVSTMDSMWGYKNERWLHLGRASARLDDVLAFVPARLSALLLCLTTRYFIPESRGLAAWRDIARDAARSASPNAGWPMAAAAHLHGARMGGAAVYHGKTVQKPRLGPENGEWSAESLKRLLRHIRLAGIAWGVAGSLGAALLAAIL